MLPARPHRSAVRARVAATRSDSAAEAQRLLLPLILAFVLALLMAWPAQVRAQGAPATTASTSGTHTVRPGETLWSLAARYFGDGHKWRELASSNGLAEGGERGIAVGQVLRVPASAASLAQSRAAMAEAPPRSTPSEAVRPAQGAPAAERVAMRPESKPEQMSESKPEAAKKLTPEPKPESRAVELVEDLAPPPMALPERGKLMGEDPAETRGIVRVGLVRQTDLAAARGNDNTTIFLGPEPFNVDTMQGTIDLSGTESFVAPAGRRAGEFVAAPFALDAGQWKSAGRVVRRASSPAVKSRELQRMQSRDLVEISLPAGMDAAPGTKFVAVVQGAEIGRGIRLAIPTGVLTVVAPESGVTMARVSRLFDVIEQDQALLPFVEAPATPVATDRLEAIESAVRWITEAPLLPSLKAYLVLAPHADMQVGDRFELSSSAEGHTRVASVRIVRIGEHGATAIIMHQDQPSIRAGMAARRVGRAP